MKNSEINADDSALNADVEVVQIDSHSRAEYDIQIATAKKYPRSLAQFKRKAIEMATYDEETAASCLYALPRAGKTIEGESIRLAEIVAASYGNIVYGARMLGNNAKTTKVVGFAWDLENNVRVMIEKEGRITYGKNSKRAGETYDDDMILTASLATSSKAVRDAIFKVVPKSLVKDVVSSAKQLIAGDVKGMSKRRDAAIAVFREQWKVEEATILEFLDIKGKDDMTGDQLIELLGFHNALKEADASERAAMIAGMKKPLAQASTTSTAQAKV